MLTDLVSLSLTYPAGALISFYHSNSLFGNYCRNLKVVIVMCFQWAFDFNMNCCTIKTLGLISIV